MTGVLLIAVGSSFTWDPFHSRGTDVDAQSLYPLIVDNLVAGLTLVLLTVGRIAVVLRLDLLGCGSRRCGHTWDTGRTAVLILVVVLDGRLVDASVVADTRGVRLSNTTRSFGGIGSNRRLG